MPEISLIIPVYNGEKTICRTIGFIKNQSFENFEVLIVDDGSTDNTAEICRRHIADDNRFRLVRKSNGGASSARNLGISESNGKWIVFMDSDDEIDHAYLQTLYENRIPSGVCMAGFFENNGGIVSVSVDFGNELYSISNRNYHEILKEIVFLSHPSPIAKIFDGDIIRAYNIRFVESISICEDLLFWLHYICKGNAVKTIAPIGYMYMKDNSTLTRRKLMFDVGFELAERTLVLMNKFAERVGKELPEQAYMFCSSLFMNALMAIYNVDMTYKDRRTRLLRIRNGYSRLIRRYYKPPTFWLKFQKQMFLNNLFCFDSVNILRYTY